MSIIDKIKSIINDFRNRKTPRLDEGKAEAPRKTSNSRDEFTGKIREGVTPYTPRTTKNIQSAPLVNNRRVQSTSQRLEAQRRANRRQYTGNRSQRKAAQERANKHGLKMKIAAISAGLALSTSCVLACTHRTPTIEQMQGILTGVSEKDLTENAGKDLSQISDTELAEISDWLEKESLDILKEKIANAIDLDVKNKDDFIKVYAGNINAPTTIETPSITFRSTQGVGVIDAERTDVISNGITNVVDMIARLQDKEHPVDRTQLKRFLEVTKTLKESNFILSPNTVVGSVLKADSEHENSLMVQYALANDIQNDSITQVTNNDFEIGD